MAQQRTVSVKVSLLAQDYFAGLQKMQAETKKTSTSAETAFNKQKAAFEQLGRTAAVASGAFTVAFVAMVKASADFEQRMSQVQALSKATSTQMTRLRDAAFTAGKAFGLSATQVADAQIELTKAGVSVKDIIGGALPGALALAAAGQIDVAKATEIASNAMTEFKLHGTDVPHVADLLAAGADKSVASVESLGDALNQSGLVAAQFGLSVEDTVGTLTAFSKAGLNGSDAGTSFKTMLTQLASPTKQAQAALDKYNITTYDTQGNFVGITSLAQQLSDKLSGANGVSQAARNSALSIIFGNDAIRAASVLYDLGGKKLQGFIDANNEAGFAALQASKKLDNLNGDVQKLGASFQNDLIKSGSGANLALRGVAQTANGLLDIFGKLPSGVQGGAVVLAGVGAAATAGAAAFLLLTPRIAAAKVAMQELNISGKGLAAGVGKGGALVIGLTALTSALAATQQQGAATAQQLDRAAGSMAGGFKGIDSLIPKNAFAGISGFQSALDASYSGDFSKNTAGITKAIDGLTFGLTRFSDTYKSSEGQIKALGTQFSSLASSDYGAFTSKFGEFIGKIGGGKTSIREFISGSEDLKKSLTDLAGQAGVTATDANLLSIATGRGGAAEKLRQAQAAAADNANALKAMSGSAVDATTDLKTLSATIAGFGSVTLDARSASRALEQAIDDASAAAKKNGKNLNIATDAGRANQAALDGIASAAANAASKILDETGSQEQAADAIRKGRKAFIDAAIQMGLSRAAAKKLADQLNLIPSNVKTAVGITGADAAAAKAAAVGRAMELLNGKKAYVDVYLNAVNNLGADPTKVSAGLLATGRAEGGSITGPGPKGKDSVLAYLAPGEHVLTAKEVDKMGGQAAVYAFRKGINAYANGGAIGANSSKAATEDASAKNLTRLISAQKKKIAADQKAADHLDKLYSDIDGTKKNAAAKKAAKGRADAAKKKVDSDNDRLDKLQKMRDEAVSQRDEFLASAQNLRNDREDFVSGQRRATPDNPIDPLSYIDQLRGMSRNDDYSKSQQQTYYKTANAYEKSLVKQQTALDAATKSLDDFKSAADSMRSSITSSIAGQYGVGNISATQSTTTGSVMRNGISFTTYGSTSGYSASGIDAYYAGGASSTAQFAGQLQQLANRGVNGALLAEIAQDPNGAQLAAALLSATTGQISSINADYAAIQGNAATAAGTVTDYNYRALITDAQANADKIAGQIASDGEKLRKLIASAFGLTGYAVGTMSATPGWHLVGEQGPELLRFAGGEQVATAARTRSMIAAASNRGAATHVHVHVTGDDSVLASAMSVVADQRIAVDAHSDAVLSFGGAA